jgi:exopolysaccharide biosynthesis polyprenyl glycosylphosphotransferase
MSKKLTLIVSDLIAFYGALAATLFVRYGDEQWYFQWLIHRAPFSLLLIVWLFALYIANLYERSVMRNDRDFFQRLGQAMIVASVASALFFYLIPSLGITPKTNLFLFLVIFSLILAGTRFLYNQVIAGGTKNRLLIVGLNPESLELARLVTNNPQLGYLVRAFVRLGQEPLPLEHDMTRWPIIEDLTSVPRFIAEKNINTVVISPAAYDMNEVVGLFYGTLSRHVDFINLTSLAERLTGRIPLGVIDQAWFLDNMTEGSKRSFDTAKRVLDIGATIVLGIPTLLITPLVALAIKLDSHGPIFIRQKRSGRAGALFDIFKFRSMYTNAEEITGAVWAKENDPRVTRVGKFIRKTRIDELPQLWNILKGDMSLVGPRAERPEFDTKLTQEIPFYRERYLIKPGLSGWAQINYQYGASQKDAVQKLQYDLYYIKHRSLVLDLEIILKTINISLRRAGR